MTTKTNAPEPGFAELMRKIGVTQYDAQLRAATRKPHCSVPNGHVSDATAWMRKQRCALTKA